jgi:hypothetical protein
LPCQEPENQPVPCLLARQGTWISNLPASDPFHFAAVLRRLGLGAFWAGELDSLLFQHPLTEEEIEYASGLGHWERGLDLAQEAIRMARALQQGSSFIRLLVWSGLLRLGRGELETARKERDVLQARRKMGAREYLVRVFVGVDRNPPVVVTAFRTTRIAK